MAYDDPFMQTESTYWPTLPAGAQQYTSSTKHPVDGDRAEATVDMAGIPCRIMPQRHRNEQHSVAGYASSHR
ncbi:hypothetical protein JK2ML_1018 [Mycobacterium leprae Kyoto-2]|uniref:Uncharacterized protein n=3 Tax=Mycobacterium leprae TaxID=1769 RepID=Q9CCB3_MYCLE|nr:hypothetical protein DIJ64_05450 [Mycobacterium leprae]OAR21447.1 hypothetical protein A8144_05930 [Mycobacterium leprae 3125609]OAX71295.1 hypothetical protein A3216_06735 [Mycobacterium leprae 7935681]CAR71113.1 hypothetical protein MLBr01018 [Mycobacterium leprae Br4923]BBC16917.1 hypothetical protein JK2ML_1018 [Mycobacterium leprae Kyoto-2]